MGTYVQELLWLDYITVITLTFQGIKKNQDDSALNMVKNLD